MKKTKAPTVEEALIELVAVLDRHGDWDEGYFYFSGQYSPMFETPLSKSYAALEAIRVQPKNSGS